jgi:hypothetical protein
MVRYTRYPLSFSIFQYPYSKFRHIVRLHLKFAWITATGLLFASLMTYCYWKFQLFTIVWYFVGIFSVVFFIYFPQRAFYKVLQTKKVKELQEISKKMESFYKKLINEYNKKDFESFKEMYEASVIVTKLHGFPFNVRSLIYTSFTILLQIILLIKTLIQKQ